MVLRRRRFRWEKSRRTIEVAFQRRFSQGLSLNAAYRDRAEEWLNIINEYDASADPVGDELSTRGRTGSRSTACRSCHSEASGVL